jgi:hypothetical protein
MKTDLIKLIALIWMVETGYIMYLIYADVSYLTTLVHSYISLVMEYTNH